MVLDIIGFISLIIFSFFDLLKTSIFLSIPLLVFSKIVLWVREKLYWKYGFSWIVGTYLSLFVFFLIALFFFYFLPSTWFLRGFFFYEGYLPDYFKLSLLELFLFVLVTLFRIFFVSLFLALILMPPAFLGSLLQEFFEEKLAKKGFVSFFLALFVSTAFWVLVTILIFPFMPLGLLYLVFFAG